MSVHSDFSIPTYLARTVFCLTTDYGAAYGISSAYRILRLTDLQSFWSMESKEVRQVLSSLRRSSTVNAFAISFLFPKDVSQHERKAVGG